MKEPMVPYIVRPKYARDKTVSAGMKLYSERWDDGIYRAVARHRAPKGGGVQIGWIRKRENEGTNVETKPCVRIF